MSLLFATIEATEQNQVAAAIVANPVVAELPAKPEPKTETLYQSTDNYDRGARERFVPNHDTVSPKWEHNGNVVSPQEINNEIYKTFPEEIKKTELVSVDGLETPHYGLFYQGKCLKTAVKEGYKPHNRQDVIACIDAAREAFSDDVKVSATWNEGHFVCVRPTDHYRREIFGKSDAVSPRLVIKAGYGGKAFSAQLGWYRDCCNNLTWLRNEGSVSRSIKHTNSLNEHIEELVAEFRICAESWEATVAHIKQAEEMKVCLTEFLSQVYGECPETKGRGKTSHEKRTSKIFNRVLTERQKTGRPEINSKTWEVSGWEAYNAIQGYSQHDATRRGNPDLLARVIKATDDKAVRTAEELVFDQVLLSA